MYNYNQFGIRIFKNEKHETAIHSDIELIYVIQGKAAVTVRDAQYVLGKGDLIVINSSIQHSVDCSGKNIVCSIKYDYQVLVHILKKPNSIFVCNSSTGSNSSYEALRKLCEEAVCEEVLGTHKTDSRKYSLLYQILDVLVESFMVEDTNTQISENYDADEKLQRMIRYVHENYQDGISLADLAKEMYTSASTLSRLFKKQTGIYFAEYVNQIRTKYAVNEMLYTEKNITKIAMDCGFANVSTFNKVFRDIYQTTPTEYRLQMKDRKVQEKQEDDDLKQELREQMSEFVRLEPSEVRVSDEQQIDVRGGAEYTKIWNRTINVGSMYNLSQANVQYHMGTLVKELGFSHVRLWSIFSKNLMIFDGATIGNYNYDMVDMIFDYIVSNHVYPWLDFTKRPNANVKAATNMLWFEDEIIEFQSRRVFEAFVEDFIKHIVRRYGEEEVSHWYFEMGVEPFHGEQTYYYPDEHYRFSEVYRFFYKMLRKYVPKAWIGYSHGAPNSGQKYLVGQFQECFLGDCLPDFVSFIMFPYVPHFGEERETNLPFLRSGDADFECNQVAAMREVMKQSGAQDCKLFISEWNITVSTRNFLNDSCFRAACLCKKVNDLIGKVDQMGFWISTDWISNYYDSRSVVNGGGGFLTKDGIRKPVFFALSLLNRLGNQLVAQGENYIVTKQSDNHLRLLYYNVEWYSSNYFLRAENLERVEELGENFDESGQKMLKLTLEGVDENRVYIIKKRVVNADHGSILDEWKKFNYDTKLERADIKYLQAICTPLLGMERVQPQKGRLHLNIQMQSQEVGMYHIFPADE